MKKITNQQTNTEEPISIFKNSYKYSGTINISIMAGQQRLKTYHYKNSGTSWLFRFLCECFCGNYAAAELLRPTKIKLFENPAEAPIEEGKPVSVDLTQERSLLVNINTTPAIVEEQGTYKAVLHFLIPFAYMINTNEGATINQFCLYGNQTTNRDLDKYSAYFYLTDETGESWQPIDFSNAQSNYNLLIEWELSISN